MKVINDKPEIAKTHSKSMDMFPVAGIATPAGGLGAFNKLLKAIPEDSGMAYVLVQHLDPKHVGLLPGLLQTIANMPVKTEDFQTFSIGAIRLADRAELRYSVLFHEDHYKEQELLRRFQRLVTQAPGAMMVVNGYDYRVEIANDSYLQMVEKGNDFIGTPLFDSLPELKSQGIKELLDKVMQSGFPYYGDEVEIHFLRSKKKGQGFYNYS